jgi:hypothetical protein
MNPNTADDELWTQYSIQRPVRNISSPARFASLPNDCQSCSKGNTYQQTSQNVVGERQFFGSTPRLRQWLREDQDQSEKEVFHGGTIGF